MSSSSPRPKTQGGSGAPTQPGRSVRLNDLVQRYLAASGGFGKPAALAALGLSRAETESTLSQFDEDYMISRFFHLSNQSGESFQINGFPQTHVTIDAAIQSVL